MCFCSGFLAAVFVKDIDVAACTISAIDDPQTLNKTLYLRPPGNVYSMNELVAIWENKIDKTLEKIYVPEEEFLKKIKGMYNVSLFSKFTINLLISKLKKVRHLIKY